MLPARNDRRAALEALIGAAAFLASVAAGVMRWGWLDPMVAGLLLALTSASLWGAGSLLALASPDRPRWSGYCNLAAACCAAAASAYIVPDDKLVLLWSLLG